MLVVGIDSSLSATGMVAMLHKPEVGAREWLGCDVITTRDDMPLAERVLVQARTVAGNLKAYADHAELRGHTRRLVVLESLAFPFGKVRWSTISALARVHGGISAMAEAAGFLVVETSPVSIKQLATGARSATKKEVVDGVLELAPGLRPLVERHRRGLWTHACDAAAAALIGAGRHGGPRDSASPAPKVPTRGRGRGAPGRGASPQ